MTETKKIGKPTIVCRVTIPFYFYFFTRFGIKVVFTAPDNAHIVKGNCSKVRIISMLNKINMHLK